MKTKPRDRRVARTQEGLRSALVALILERGYERITVQDIAERANVGRSTFYAHFRDKEDLLVSGFDELKKRLLQAERAARPAARDRPLPFTRALFEHVLLHRPLYEAMVGKEGGAAAERKMRRMLTQLTRDDLAPVRGTKRNTALPLDVVIEFVVASLLAIIRWSLQGRVALTAEEVDDTFRQLTLPGVQAAVR